MKRTLSILIVLLLCLSVFIGCDNVLSQNGGSQTTNTECEHDWERIGNLNESTAQDRCTKCGETRLYTDPDSINKPNDEIAGMKGTRVWDWHHPDDSERNPEWAITFASMPNVEFKRENSSVYANDELLIGGSGYACMSFYTAKLTVANKTLLCFGMSLGSGICDERIVIIDFDTKQEIFVIHDRMNYNYQLFVRNGILCVREIKYGTNEITRTGIFYDEGTQIQISWDEHIVLDEDRTPVVDNSTPICSSIRLSYHGNKNNSVLIEDENVCSELMSFILKSGGTQGESTKGYYGVPYTLTIYYEGEQEPLDFSVWSSGQYSTSKHKDNEGYQFFYNDDISDLYKYLEEKYPDEFWYPITTDNSQSK